MAVSNANWLDGVPRTPLIPQLPVPGWENFSYQYQDMYRNIYDAIMKIRAGEISLVEPTAASSFTPSQDYHLMTKISVAGAYVPKSLFTAKGDMIAASAANTPLKLSSGADGKFLMSDAASPAGVKWESVHGRQHSLIATADHTSLATAGRMLKADANGLPVEATNTDTAVASAVTNSHACVHDILSSSHGDALAGSAVAGAIIVGNGTPKWSRMLKGSETQVLVMYGGTPTWRYTYTTVFYHYDPAYSDDSFISDGTWHAKDLSGQVGSGAVALVLAVNVGVYGGGAAFRCGYDTGIGGRVSVGTETIIVVPCFEGIYEYRLNAGTNLSVACLGSWNMSSY